MIHELLKVGSENAITGRSLANALGVDIRTVTEAIKSEREHGQPICATPSGENAGYYLAANKEEMQTYCNSIRHRAGELFATRRALLKTIDTLPGGIDD